MSRRKKSRAIQRAEYVLYRMVMGAAARLSESAARRLGSRVGSISRHILRRRDRVAMRNLEIAFPEKPRAERRRILNECWRHFGRELINYLRLQSMPLDEIAARCDFVNAHLIHDALARGKGVVVISAHWGGWEVAGLAVMAIVRNVHLVARPLDNEFLERDLSRIRARTGAAVVDRRNAARPLMKALAANGIVVILPDQRVVPREGVLVPFLGRPAWTTIAPARMALRQGSSVVFAFCIPDGTRHRLEFEEPFRMDALSPDEREPVALTKRMNDVISQRITEHPELWLWMHDRWKGTLESEVSDG